MTLNDVRAIISAIEFGSFVGQLHHRHRCSLFRQCASTWFRSMVVFSKVIDSECVKVWHPNLTAKIQIVGDCTAISAIAEFLLVTWSQSISMCVQHYSIYTQLSIHYTV